MKKKSFRIVSWLMTIAMCFAIGFPGFAVAPDVNAEITKEIRAALGDEFMQKMAEQERAVEAYHYFCEYYEKNNDDTFTDSYGGEYIEGDKLYIYYVDTTSSFEKVLEKHADVVVFEKVKYSLDYLREINEKMYAAAPGKGQITYEISTKDNRIIISGDRDAIAKYQNTIDQVAKDNNVPDIVRYQEVDNVEITPTTTPLYGGTGLYLDGDTRQVNRTISVCGTYNGHQAFITCGHMSAIEATSVYDIFTTVVGSNIRVGTVEEVVFANGGYGDYSIVKINTTAYNATNQMIHYSPSYVECAGGDRYYASGQYLIKYGAYGEWAGVRVDSEHPYTTYTYRDSSDNVLNGWTIRGLKRTVLETGVSREGDSGGPIIRYDSTNGDYYYCGANASFGTRIVNDTTITNVYFSPYSLVDPDFVI